MVSRMDGAEARIRHLPDNRSRGRVQSGPGTSIPRDPRRLKCVGLLACIADRDVDALVVGCRTPLHPADFPARPDRGGPQRCSGSRRESPIDAALLTGPGQLRGNSINTRREQVRAGAEIVIRPSGIGTSASPLRASGDPRVVRREPASPIQVSSGQIQRHNRIFVIVRRLARQNRLRVSGSCLLTQLNRQRNQIIVARRHVNLAARDIDHRCAGPHRSATISIWDEVRLPEDLPVG